MYFSYFVYHSVARVTRVRAVALNNTAVNVSWTPVTIQETDHIFTIHYTAVGGTKRQSSSGKNFEKTSSPLVTCTHLKLSCPAAGAVNVTAGSSSGVVGGLLVVCMVLTEKEEISLTGQQGGVEAQLAALVAWRVELVMEGLSLECSLFSRIASMSAPRSYHG